MAQFDVHRNIGKQRDTVPYVVVVQSSLYDNYRRRLVVPLVKKAVLNKGVLPALNPAFKIEGESVVLHPLDMVSVALDNLGEYVASLADDGDVIVKALDEVLTRAWK